MKLKKFLAVGVAVMLSVGSLTGCSSSNNASTMKRFLLIKLHQREKRESKIMS